MVYGPKMHMVVHGNMDLNVGAMVIVDIPTTGKSESYTDNTQYSGKSMITAVAHVFTPYDYYCHAECSQNASNNAIPGEQVVLDFKELTEKTIKNPQDEINIATGNEPDETPESLSTDAFPSKRGGRNNNDNSVGTFPTGTSGGSGGGGGGGSGGGGFVPPVAVPEIPVGSPASVPIQVDGFVLTPSEDVFVAGDLTAKDEFQQYVSDNLSILEIIRLQDINGEFTDEFDANATRDEKHTLLSTLAKRQKINEQTAEYIRKRKQQKGCD